MINLLPEQQRKAVHDAYVMRLAVVAGFLLTGIFAAGMLLLVPAYLVVSQELRTIQAQSADVMERNRLLEAERAMAVVEATESLVARGRVARSPLPLPSQAVRAVVERTNSRVSLKTISVSDGKVRLMGEANDRQSLLAFVAALEQERGTFATVNSPITNLIRDKDLSFTLTLDETH